MFGGQCEAAFRLYERVLSGKIINLLAYGKSPMTEQMPPGWRGKIVRGTFAVGGAVLAGADVLPEQYVKPQGFYVLLSVDDAMDAERIFSPLAKTVRYIWPFSKPSGHHASVCQRMNLVFHGRSAASKRQAWRSVSSGCEVAIETLESSRRPPVGLGQRLTIWQGLWMVLRCY